MRVFIIFRALVLTMVLLTNTAYQVISGTIQTPLDSLVLLLKHTEDAEKPGIILQLADEYKSVSLIKSREYADLALETATKLNRPSLIAESYIRIGNVNWLEFKYHKAIHDYELASQQFIEVMDSTGISLAYNNIASVYKDLKEYESAVEWHQKALDIRTKMKDKIGMAGSLHHIGGAYWNLRNFQQAIEFYQKALSLRQFIGDSLGIASTLSNIALVFKDLGYFKEALSNHFESLAIRKKIGDKMLVAISLNNIGSVYWSLHDYGKSVEYYIKSLEIREDIGDKKDIAGSLSNIGNVYKNLQSYDKALNYYKRSLEIRKQLGDKSLISYTLNDIGSIHWNLHRFDSALVYYEKALVIRREIGDEFQIANSLRNIGVVYKDLGKIPIALERYKSALAIFEELSDKINIGTVLNYMGNAYRKSKDYVNANSYYSKALIICKEDFNPGGIALTLKNIGELCLDQGKSNQSIAFFEESLKNATIVGDEDLITSLYFLLSEQYSLAGNYKNAYLFNMKYTAAREARITDEGSKKIAELQSNYENEKREKELELLENQRKLGEEKRKAESQKQKVQNYIITGSLAILLIIILLLYRNYNNKKKANVLLGKQKDALEEQGKKLLEVNKLLERKNTVITDSISYAKRIQDTILPSERLRLVFFPKSFVFYRPRDIVSGDFYWLCKSNEKLFFALADCTGHGVPGAFMSMIGNALLNDIVKEHKIYDPATILQKLNERVLGVLSQGYHESEQQEDGMDITLICFDRFSRKLQISCAKHTAYIVQNKAITTIEGGLFSIGGLQIEGQKSCYQSNEFDIQDGMILYMLSDGFADQFGGPENKKFMNSRMMDTLVSISDAPIREQGLLLEKIFTEWKGNSRQMDDVLVTGIQL